MTDAVADLYDTLAMAYPDAEQRDEHARRLHAAGLTPRHVLALADRATHSLDPAAYLRSTLADAASARSVAARLTQDQPDHVAAWGDALAKSRSFDTASGMTEAEAERRRFAAELHTAMAVERLRLRCHRRAVCQTDERRHPPCCLNEWLRRRGRQPMTGQAVFDLIRDHCSRHPEDAWDADELEAFGRVTGEAQVRAFVRKVLAAAAVRRAVVEAEASRGGNEKAARNVAALWRKAGDARGAVIAATENPLVPMGSDPELPDARFEQPQMSDERLPSDIGGPA